MNPRSLVIQANGPSLNDVQGLELLKDAPGLDTLVVNTPHPALWPSTYWCFADHEITQRHKDLIPSYEGTIISCLRVPEAKHVLDFDQKRGIGWSRDWDFGLFIGRSTTYAALQFATIKGYRRIYVLGLDMQETDGRRFHNYDEQHNPPEIRCKRFAGEAVFYDHMAYSLSEEERSRIVLCGRASWPFTTKFTRLSPETAVGHILSSLRGEY